ncbi:hypothetical protein D9C01_13430, partial [Corynebacterium diphtheriae]
RVELGLGVAAHVRDPRCRAVSVVPVEGHRGGAQLHRHPVDGRGERLHAGIRVEVRLRVAHAAAGVLNSAWAWPPTCVTRGAVPSP